MASTPAQKMKIKEGFGLLPLHAPADFKKKPGHLPPRISFDDTWSVFGFRLKTKASTWFESLSFTNKKEYIEWVITAKQEKTRTERVKGTKGSATLLPVRAS